ASCCGCEKITGRASAVVRDLYEDTDGIEYGYDNNHTGHTESVDGGPGTSSIERVEICDKDEAIDDDMLKVQEIDGGTVIWIGDEAQCGCQDHKVGKG